MISQLFNDSKHRVLFYCQMKIAFFVFTQVESHSLLCEKFELVARDQIRYISYFVS